MLHMIIAAVTMQNFTVTPQRAAINAVGMGLKKPPVVVRTNVVGRYATVLTKGGMMEGRPVTEPIFVERFSFGWQALQLLNCRLESRALGAHTEALLMRGMPSAKGTACYERADAGPPMQVAAVRRMMQGPLVPSVVVSGNWALGEWYGAGGGESLFQNRNGRWKLITSGGGAMGVAEMRAFGIPRASWCAFGIYDAHC